MASGADWRNSNQMHTNSPQKAQGKDSPSRDRKFENLSSTLAMGEEDYSVRPYINTEVTKSDF